MFCIYIGLKAEHYVRRDWWYISLKLCFQSIMIYCHWGQITFLCMPVINIYEMNMYPVFQSCYTCMSGLVQCHCVFHVLEHARCTVLRYRLCLFEAQNFLSCLWSTYEINWQWVVSLQTHCVDVEELVFCISQSAAAPHLINSLKPSG
jgi:hypothetical protein